MEPVCVREEPLVLRTYPVGPEDPNPPFQRQGIWDVYPYTLIDDIRTEGEDQTYCAVVLENEYIRVTVLPELGGHVYSLHDKSCGKEVLYRNSVIKPGLVALRGAWLAYGIEFNYPAGHAPTTVSPVAYCVDRRPDGSATCWVGALEYVTRVKWLVGITVAPGRTWLETDVRIANRTPLSKPLYFWENAGVYAPDNLSLVYPAKRVILAGGGTKETYPVAEDGRDISLYRNHVLWNDIFCLGVKEGFFGAYYPSSDCGVVHVGDYRESVGKKFFTWGVADSGLAWAKILSDDDGPYCEIQSGRFATQSIWEFIHPGNVEAWRECWWPVHDIGGFRWANADAAVDLRADGTGWRVGVCVSRAIPGARAIVLVDGRPAWQWTGELAPDRPLRHIVSGIAADAQPLLRVEEARGLVIEYQAGQEPGFDPDAADRQSRRWPPETERSPREHLAVAIAAEKHGGYAEAERLFRKAVEEDGEMIDGLLGLTRCALRRARYADAERLARRTLVLSPDTVEAEYLLGLALRGLEDLAGAEDHLWQCMRHPGTEAVAAVQLAEIALARGDDTAGRRLLGRALARQGDNPRSWCLSAAAHRRAGDVEGALAALAIAEELDPTDSLAAIEAWLCEPSDDARARIRACTRGLVQDYLEAAHDYLSIGALEDAVQALDLGVQDGPGAPEPLCRQPERDTDAQLHYHRAYALWRLGRDDEAHRALDAAAALSPDLVFPHRPESLPVFEWVAQRRPEDGQAFLVYGNLLMSLGRREDAARAWQRAAELRPDLAVAHRNLGLLAQWSGDRDTAIACYGRAIEGRPTDYRYHRDLDDLLRDNRHDPADRARRLDSAPASAASQQDIVWRRAVLHTVLADYDTAVGLLTSHTFRPWEGAVVMRRHYMEALVARGRNRWRNGDLDGAATDFESALEYPENIGQGRLPEPKDVLAWWFAAQGRYAKGLHPGAEEALRQGIAEKHDPASEGRYYQIRCLQCLGRNEEAANAAREMLAAAGKRVEERPEDGSAHSALGLAQLLTGDGEAGRASLQRAIELDPMLVEPRERLRDLEMGVE